ncbi:TPM domain-containing protein [Pseudolysinimonas sp.]|uniref:TPM domain-containing protein n=1 Tax=Pseudolysinimonas sp. TaxID=2680009 RepID=UPI003783C676
MRIRAVVGSLLGGVALAFLMASPVVADEPVDLGASPVLDAAGVLDDATVEAAIDDTFARTGVSLFVVVVETFESPTNADDWATRTAERNGLGVDDVLLAIAVDDRTYSLSTPCSPGSRSRCATTTGPALPSVPRTRSPTSSTRRSPSCRSRSGAESSPSAVSSRAASRSGGAAARRRPDARRRRNSTPAPGHCSCSSTTR